MVLMQDHYIKLLKDPDFQKRLSESLADTSRLETLLNQNQVESSDSRRILRNHFNSSHIRRFILEPRILRQCYDQLQSGSVFEEWPLQLVLTFLKTATIPPLQ
jgi:hypothetical protein